MAWEDICIPRKEPRHHRDGKKRTTEERKEKQEYRHLSLRNLVETTLRGARWSSLPERGRKLACDVNQGRRAMRR